MKEKKAKKANYPYKLVDGLTQGEIDRYLVEMFSVDILSKIVLKNSYLVKNLPFNRLQLMNCTIPHNQLVDEITDHLGNCYDVFNHMMFQFYPSLQRLENELKKEKEYMGLKDENEQNSFLYKRMRTAIETEPFKKNKLVCWLRLKPQLHGELVKYTKETQSVEEEVAMPIFEESVVLDVSLEEGTFLTKLGRLKEMIASMEEEAEKIDGENIEHLRQEITKLNEEGNTLRVELKGKDKEIKSKEKEIVKLQKRLHDEEKRLENEHKAIEKYKKENGELGKKLGNARTELESIKGQKKALEGRNIHLEKLLEDQDNRITADYENKLNSKLSLQKSEFDEELESLKDMLEKTKRMNEDIFEKLRMENVELQSANQKLMTDIQDLKDLLKEKERKIAKLENGNSEKESEHEKIGSEDLTNLFDNSEFEPEFS